MKIKFIKKHLDHKEGESIDVTDAAGEYLVSMGVAQESGRKEKAETKEADEKPTSEKNKAAGPVGETKKADKK